MGREQKRKLLRVFFVALAILLLAGVLLILRHQAGPVARFLV